MECFNLVRESCSRPPGNAPRRPRAPEDAPQHSLNAAKTVPKLFQDASRRTQDGPKTPPRPLQARKQGALSSPHRVPFWKDFGAMLAPRGTKRLLKKHTKFSLIWKSIFHRFSSILAGFWRDLGSKLASKIH